MSTRGFARARVARRVVDLYLKTASPELVQRAFPALSAAFDTYSLMREQEQQAARARQFATYPGAMTEHSMFGGGPMQGPGWPSAGWPTMDTYASAPGTPSVVHHRRHRHHY